MKAVLDDDRKVMKCPKCNENITIKPFYDKIGIICDYCNTPYEINPEGNLKEFILKGKATVRTYEERCQFNRKV